MKLLNSWSLYNVIEDNCLVKHKDVAMEVFLKCFADVIEAAQKEGKRNQTHTFSLLHFSIRCFMIL